MSLFVAGVDQTGLQSSATRFGAEIVHLDDEHSIVWLWVPDWVGLRSEENQGPFYVWNPDLPVPPQRFAELNATGCYKGLIRIIVSNEALAKQRPSLHTLKIEPAPWPLAGRTLQDVVDGLDSSYPLTERLQILKAIALYATSQNFTLQSDFILERWLAGTEAPQPKKDLANVSVFADFLGKRPYLFAELERLVIERRMVILLGTKQSGLKEFLAGFQKSVECSPSGKFAYVTASFNSSHFQQIYDDWKTFLELPELDCLFAALAFSAVNGLVSKTGKVAPNFLTAKMIEKPVDFARPYLANAGQHKDHWDCIQPFLQFLRKAAEEAGIAERITIFLPFEEIEQIINGNNEAQRQLWQGLLALRDKLKTEPHHCPQLGLVLAVQELAIDQMTEPQFVRQVLTIPPLSRAEIGNLLESFWGSPPNTKELDAIESCTGGDPWFVYLFFRCLKAVTEKRIQTNDSVRSESAIAEVCRIAFLAIGSDGDDDSPDPVPLEVREDCGIYLDECSEILRQYQGELGTRKVLTAWKHPNSYYHTQRRKMDKFELAWILTGLVYVQGLNATRVDTLESLHEYPLYQFCRAGKLPLEFAERVLRGARYVNENYENKRTGQQHRAGM